MPARPADPIWTHVLALADGGALLLGSDNRCTPGGPVMGDGHSVARLDPAVQTWTATAPLNKDRGEFVALRLSDGRVLVTAGGGEDAPDAVTSFSSTKLWDPKAGTWRDGGLLGNARTGAFGVLLRDGSVLVGGGVYAVKGEVKAVLASVERYDPATDKWTSAPRLPGPMENATAATLADGSVLALGHNDADWVSARYDGRAWRAIDFPQGSYAFPELVALSDGGVLELDDGGAHRFDAASNRWSTVTAPRTFGGAQAVLLPGGRVLVAGGSGEGESATVPALTRADLWDPVAGTWAATADMSSPRAYGDMALLADGSVLYAGGGSADDFIDTPGCPTSSTDAVRWVPGG